MYYAFSKMGTLLEGGHYLRKYGIYSGLTVFLSKIGENKEWKGNRA